MDEEAESLSVKDAQILVVQHLILSYMVNWAFRDVEDEDEDEVDETFEWSLAYLKMYLAELREDD